MPALRHFSLLSLTVLPSKPIRDATICTWFSACLTTTYGAFPKPMRSR